MKKRCLLGMSGGVDSSAAALLLLRAGYEVTGATMLLHAPGGGVEDARRVCRALGVGHITLDFTAAFRREVIDVFAARYAAGLTPNPCLLCNRGLKFGAFLRYALQNGFDFIATGHYASIQRRADGRYLLRRADSAKDQSYVLYQLTQDQLAHTLFPLSAHTKPEIRALAEEAGLPVAHKKDSQEICFVPDNDYAAFLERHTGAAPPRGNFVDAGGAVLGRHNGITRYTVGQRKGLGVSFGKPMYVTRIDARKNEITLGEEGSQYAGGLIAEEMHYIPFDAPAGPLRVYGRVRYQAAPAPCTLTPLAGGCARVAFDAPQRAVAPGQAAVFYDGDLVVGGGVIRAAIS